MTTQRENQNRRKFKTRTLEMHQGVAPVLEAEKFPAGELV
jgi:hypothetical protein